MKSLFNRTWPAVVAAAMLVMHGGLAAAQQPAMPASPLAGGAAAAGDVIDVHGNSVVMPASYGEMYAPYGAACPDGYGAPAYADFGGYGPDQCGPYYYDIAVHAVVITPEDLFKDVPPLAAVGVAGPTIVDIDNQYDDKEVGWAISGRFDIGALSVFEANYTGFYDIGFKDFRISEIETANAGQPSLPDQLTSVFSQYGLDPILGLDAAEFYTTDYKSDLQSTEFTYRRYWLGYSPRISGTMLAGFRYIRMTEDLIFAAGTQDGLGGLVWRDENDMLGFQMGGDGWICLRQGLRVGAEGKAGIYNNRFVFRHATAIPDPDITNVDDTQKGDSPAFAGEFSVDVVADILPSFSIRGGYQALYFNRLVTIGNNIYPDEFADGVANTPFPLTHADVIYHGFHAGLEYIW